MVIDELFVKCPDRGGYYCYKITWNLQKVFNKEKATASRSLKPQKCAGWIVADSLDQGHVQNAETYLQASFLTQMPALLLTEFKQGF